MSSNDDENEDEDDVEDDDEEDDGLRWPWRDGLAAAKGHAREWLQGATTVAKVVAAGCCDCFFFCFKVRCFPRAAASSPSGLGLFP